jgi:hypothetical protein
MLSTAQCVVLNHQIVDNKSERMWKEVFMANIKVLGVTEENMNNFNQGSQCHGQDLNQAIV